jgi:glycosyltransferase involved in cell wall biosynthesis
VHNHLEVYSGIVNVALRRTGVPVIVSFHNTEFEAQHPRLRRPGLRQLRAAFGTVSMWSALGSACAITGCSDGVVAMVRSRRRTIRAPLSTLYYGVADGVTLDPDARDAVRASVGVSPAAPMLLHVGRLIEQKNHHGLFDVYERVRATVPTAELVLVGDGPLSDHLRSEVARRQLDGVHFVGLRDDVPSVMAAADVFVFPSLFEGLPVVTLETAAAGLPLVASRIPGMDESTVDGATACLLDVHDIDGMAAAVTAIITEPDRARRMSDAARRFAASGFSLDVSAAALSTLYTTTVEPLRRSTIGTVATGRSTNR